MTARLSCPHCRGGALRLEEDHGIFVYSCYLCSREFPACPTPDCPGVLNRGVCSICRHGDPALLGARPIVRGG